MSTNPKYNAYLQEIEAQKSPAYQKYLAEIEGPEPSGLGKIGGALRAAISGATFGFADEIVGSVEGALSPDLSMAEGRERQRAKDVAFREEHPVLSGAGTIAGAAAPFVAANLLTGGGASAAMAPTLGRAVASGAGLGAVAGVGEASGGVGERLKGAAGGAAAGGATAGVMGGLGSLLRRIRPLAPTNALRTLAKRAGADQTSIATVAKEASSATKPLMLADYGGENLRGLTRGVRTLPGTGKNEIAESLMERSAGAEERILGDLLETTGLRERTNTFRAAKDIIEERAETARPLYQAAHSVEVKDDRLRGVFEIPQFQQAYERGGRLARLEGDDIPPIETLLEKGGAVPVKALDYTKRGLDDLIDSGMRGGSIGRGEARALRGKLNDMLEVVDELVPEFAEARSYYKGESDLLEAAETGRGLFKKHPDEIAEILKNPKLTPGEKDLLRRGMFESLADRIESVATGNDIGRRVADKTLDNKRLRLLFDDDASYNRFRDLLGQEMRMHQTKNFVLGGSQTADKLAEVAELKGVGWLADAFEIATSAPTALARLGVRAAGKRAGEKASREVTEQLQPVLTAQGREIPRALEGLRTTSRTQEAAREAKSLRRLPFAAAVGAMLLGR